VLDTQVLGFAFAKIIQLLLIVACCENCFKAIGGICSAYPHLITAKSNWVLNLIVSQRKHSLIDDKN